jgi:predicted neuraminidase
VHKFQKMKQTLSIQESCQRNSLLIIVAVILISSVSELNAVIFKTSIFEHDTTYTEGHLFFNHAASIEVFDAGTELPNGDTLESQRLIVAAFGGIAEGFRDNVIWCCISNTSGQSWSEPVIITNEEDIQGDSLARDPLLFQRNGRLWLMYLFQHGLGSGWRSPRIDGYLRWSDNAGDSWSDPRIVDIGEIQDGNFKQVTPISPPVALNDSTLGFPFYYRYVGEVQAYFGFMRCDENMESFNVELFEDITLPLPSKINEPTIFQSGDDFTVYFRSSRGEIDFITTDDNGDSWSDITGTGLPNSSTKIEAITYNDELILALNNSFRARDNLSILRGNHLEMETICYVDKLEGNFEQKSYPSIRIDNSGNIHMVYSSMARNQQGYRFGNISYARITTNDFLEAETNTHDYSEYAVLNASEVIIDYAINGQSIIAADRNNEIAISHNGGQTWDKYPVVDEGELVITDLEYIDDDNLMISTKDGFYSSEDGGESWTLEFSTPEALSGMNYVGENHYIGYSVNRLYHSVGESDSTLWNFGSQYFSASSFIDENNGWVIGSRGNLFVTGDGGLSWGELESESIPLNASAICFESRRNGWLTTTRGQIFKTISGGIDWELVYESEMYNIKFESITSDGWNVFAVGSGIVVHCINRLDFNIAFEWDIGRQFVHVSTTDEGVYIGDWKGHIYHQDLLSIEKPFLTSLLPQSLALGSIYPNPFNSTVNIVFQVNRQISVKARITDMLGRQERLLVDTHLVPNSYHLTWSPKTSSGSYILTLSSEDGEIFTQPLIFAK